MAKETMSQPRAYGISGTNDAPSNGTSIPDRTLIVRICEEHSRSLDVMAQVKKHHAQFIACRWRMGKLIAEAIGERGKYGDKVVTQLAERTGLHENTIYECRKLAAAVPTEKALTEWIAKTSGREGVVLWKNVRDLIWDKNDVETLGVEGATERRLNNIEKRMQRIGEDMADALQLAKSKGVGEALREQAVGVSIKVIEMTNNPRENYAVAPAPRDDAHTQFIREMDCYWCGEASRQEQPSHPHHYETFGAAGKGSDFTQIPSCWKCHRRIHDESPDVFIAQTNCSFERALADVLHYRFTGRFIEWNN